ncbi:hypothetical protein UA08_05185 [Talaromyces atroroseus]|uniref:Zn(2)-C6 fungal-type domain-containing protein n=1 Tax=Talaromyces atroroseus TaxID=1441469 RepID=A0A225B0K5_TALAT|nr:hypothetical protein UA08_05185 [Talaromyces atroroseus]OKL59317.1 hypothetical protein UA08_05185 [Talaromyces atroroseus]
MSSNLPVGTQAESAGTAHRGREIKPESTSSIDAATHSSLPPRLPTLIPVEGLNVTQAQQIQVPRFLSAEDLRSNPTPQVPGISSAATLSQAISGSPQLHGLSAASTVRTLPPRSTRRAKAHVASACVNCKRKHLGCDSARPCRRCVLSGKARQATCVDVTHKKRGRPPLRAEETPSRAAPALESTVSSREQYQTATGRGLGHSKASSREIRPITDLQYSRPPEHGTAGLHVGTNSLTASSGRWQPYTSPQILPAAQRPISSSGPPPPPGLNYTPSSFIHYHQTTFSPSAGASDMPVGLNYGDRPPAVTTPTVSPQQYQQHYPPKLQSHISPQTPSRGLDTPGSSLGFRDPYSDSAVRLPPILPSPPTFAPHTSTYSHRRGDSYPNMATYQSLSSPQHELSPQTGRAQGSPRSMLDPLSARRELISPFPSIPGPPQNVMTPAGPDERSQQYQTQTRSAASVSGAAAEPVYDRRRKSEADDEENPQPAKRRRMAVDDIVND